MSDLSFSALEACRDLAGLRTLTELRNGINRAMAELTGARISLLLGFDDSGNQAVCLAASPGAARFDPVDVSGAGWPEHPLNFLFSSKRALWEADSYAALVEARSFLFNMEVFGRFVAIPGRRKEGGYADMVQVLLVPSNIRPTRRTFTILSVFAGYGAELLAAAARRPAPAAPPPSPAVKPKKSSPFPYWESIIGESASIAQLRDEIKRFAPTNLTVLVTGETGTGKELVARALHEHSNRRDGPFIAVNTTTLPTQLIESELFGHVKGSFTGAGEDRSGLIGRADGGTLFLDEIGDLPYDLQAKLLRVLQEKRFRPVGSDREVHSNFRLICATHRNLAAMLDEKTFREDLFYRINQAAIHVAPLRERGQDILLLAEHFLDRYARDHDEPIKILQPETRRALMDRSFGGNVRELMGLLQRAAAEAGEGYFIHPDHLAKRDTEKTLAAQLPKGATLPEAISRYERELIARAMEVTDGNRKLCAAELGVPLRTLVDKLNRYEI